MACECMQVSCTTATPVFSDRLSFPNYFQFLPSTADFAPAFVSIIKQFNWRHVVILLQDENVYTMVAYLLMIRVHTEGSLSIVCFYMF